MKPAVFLDRDGTSIEHVHHLCDPDEVRLIPGAIEALAVLRDSGYACVLVTTNRLSAVASSASRGWKRSTTS